MPTLGTAIAPKTKLTHTCFAFEFYAAVAPRNRIVHTVTVPIILWTFVVGLAKIPIVVLFEVFPFNVSFTVTFLYILYYLLLEPVAGAIFAPFLLTLTYSANLFALRTCLVWQLVAYSQVACWSFQLLGYAVLEKSSPGFLHSTLKAFLLNPLFLFMEFLFLIGYRPALHLRIREKTKANLHPAKTD